MLKSVQYFAYSLFYAWAIHITLGGWGQSSKFNYSEYGHFAYQIKWDHEM